MRVKSRCGICWEYMMVNDCQDSKSPETVYYPYFWYIITHKEMFATPWLCSLFKWDTSQLNHFVFMLGKIPSSLSFMNNHIPILINSHRVLFIFWLAANYSASLMFLELFETGSAYLCNVIPIQSWQGEYSNPERPQTIQIFFSSSKSGSFFLAYFRTYTLHG